jgi:hypothetical protein
MLIEQRKNRRNANSVRLPTEEFELASSTNLHLDDLASELDRLKPYNPLVSILEATLECCLCRHSEQPPLVGQPRWRKSLKQVLTALNATQWIGRECSKNHHIYSSLLDSPYFSKIWQGGSTLAAMQCDSLGCLWNKSEGGVFSVPKALNLCLFCMNFGRCK